MSNQQELIEVRFTEETAAIFKEENDPKYMLFKMALKLAEESKEAIAYLGEFTSIVMDDNGLYEESREFYHYSRYEKLESDMLMFIEMMTNLIDNRDKDNYILTGSSTDFEESNPLMAFSTKRPINGSFLHSPPIDVETCYDTSKKED